jgi:DNA (cytosine-5)-methyltransferase 1
MHRFNYKWNLKDGYPAPGIEKNGKKVFSTFACGGGSSMGYKLAGYDVIGANDIDPKMAQIYKHNHKPKYFLECPISEMLTMDLPEELYDLDILDGSPPCSTFSLAGSREKNWKKEKKFREGQSEQVLSDLFFEWIELVDRLQPKVAIAENVKGMLIGNAKLYTKQVVKELEKIGYTVQVFLLNAASMGVPQRRERVFFVCNKLNKKINLDFKEEPIMYKKIKTDKNDREIGMGERKIWENRRLGDKDMGDTLKRMGEKGNRFTTKYIYMDEVPLTITASDGNVLFDEPRKMNDGELYLASSFPLDYDFLDNKVEYIVGMSVPPVMMANVSYEVYNQLLKDIKNE